MNWSIASSNRLPRAHGRPLQRLADTMTTKLTVLASILSLTVASAASAQKVTAVPAVPGVPVAPAVPPVPYVDLHQFDLPRIELPHIELPHIEIPEVHLDFDDLHELAVAQQVAQQIGAGVQPYTFNFQDKSQTESQYSQARQRIDSNQYDRALE